jgi:hypothetical protein
MREKRLFVKAGNIYIKPDCVLCIETPEEVDNDFRYVHLTSGAILSVRQPVIEGLAAALEAAKAAPQSSHTKKQR